MFFMWWFWVLVVLIILTLGFGNVSTVGILLEIIGVLVLILDEITQLAISIRTAMSHPDGQSPDEFMGRWYVKIPLSLAMKYGPPFESEEHPVIKPSAKKVWGLLILFFGFLLRWFNSLTIFQGPP